MNGAVFDRYLVFEHGLKIVTGTSVSLVAASNAQLGAAGVKVGDDLQGHAGVDPPSTETHSRGATENVSLRLGIEPARDTHSQLVCTSVLGAA